MLPNFLIIGAPRSGTDFLFYSLAAHPKICIARKREVHFFDRNYDKETFWYEQFFSHCSTSQYIGEKTANYLINPDCAKRIKETLGEVKLIVILRNPIERLYSHYRNWVGLRRIDLQTSFRKFIHLHPEILAMGNYYDLLKRYLAYFEMKHILVIFFEKLIKFPSRIYNEVLAFLSINDKYQLKEFKKYNVAKKIYRFRGYTLSQRDLKIVEKLLPKSLALKLLAFLEYKFQPISAEDKIFLREYYREQNEKLFNLLNIHKDW